MSNTEKKTSLLKQIIQSQIDKPTIIITTVIIIFCTLLGSYNTIKGQQKLIEKKITILESILHNQQIYLNKLKKTYPFSIEHNNKLTTLTLKKSKKTNSNLRETTMKWAEILQLYLTTENKDQQSSFFYKDVSRNNTKLISAITRYNKESSHLDTILSKFPHKQMSKIIDIKEYKKIDIAINNNDYEYYD